LATSKQPAVSRSQPSLFDAAPDIDDVDEPVTVVPTVVTPVVLDPDAAARQFAIDPRNHVVLEASAGTGKTSVLVARYVNLLKAGIDPSNILAITFTRKAAAEMRERILHELRAAAANSEIDRARWVELRDRVGDIAISTIDAFCLSLLREFPLEADLDPGFDMADETEVPRLIEEALDRALRTLTHLAPTEPEIALVFAQLGMSRTREGLASLLDRRLVAWPALDRFLAKGPSSLTAEAVCGQAVDALRAVLGGVDGGLDRFLADGPVGHPRFQLLARELRRLPSLGDAPNAEVRAVLDRVALHFLTGEGKPRKSPAIQPYKAAHYPSEIAGKRHRAVVLDAGQAVQSLLFAFNRDLNVVLARGIRRMFAVALAQYRRTLEDRSVLDFSDVLERALELLRRMDEFAQSRFRLEARYHHVLVDEFQDTSRAQWELISLLIRSWGEGLGLASHPSVFIVGDRKQSIYRFRDAEAGVLNDAARFIQSLGLSASPRRSIVRSFRAVPELLQFVNELFSEMADPQPGGGRFTYTDDDRFPHVEGLPPVAQSAKEGPASRRFPLGAIAAETPEACAAGVADEIARILREDTVRDRKTGVARPASPGDIAILFRSRASHREFEHELEERGIPSYVYKGLGFFDADETKDVMALIRYLADPRSNLRAAALLRSRFIRLSDHALSVLAPELAASLTSSVTPSGYDALGAEDRRVLDVARRFVPEWLALADRIPPAELLETVIAESAYAYELRGPRQLQAWENLKKMRSLVRRIQNRGYATLPRIADHLDSLTAGDESNAVLEALDAVNLMTVHASKGLEFPIVFVVNLAKGASGPPRPVRVIVEGTNAADGDETSVSIGPFVSEMDEADRERERHETRRLLYVAATRARDRLYLSSALKNGEMVPGRGSLGEVLPASIKALIAKAAYVTGPVTWTGAAGAAFEFRACPVPGSPVSP
jgi:ATP-dependent helicase/nuclease subunit A